MDCGASSRIGSLISEVSMAAWKCGKTLSLMSRYTYTYFESECFLLVYISSISICNIEKIFDIEEGNDVFLAIAIVNAC